MRNDGRVLSLTRSRKSQSLPVLALLLLLAPASGCTSGGAITEVNDAAVSTKNDGAAEAEVPAEPHLAQ